MLLSELRDLFVVKYKTECRKRKIDYIDLGDKIIASYLTEALQDISSKLHVLENYDDISLEASTEFTTYDLPQDFGGLKGKPSINGTSLKVKNISDLPTSGTLSTGTATDSECAVYNDGDGWKIYLYPLPNAAATLRVWYFMDLSHYSPSGDSAFENFDGTSFSGSVKLPDRYVKAIMLYMLSQIFDEIEIKYLRELSSLRGNFMNSIDDEIKYDIGGGISY